MTYLSMLCLNGIIGIMIPYILILGLVIPEIKNKNIKLRKNLTI